MIKIRLTRKGKIHQPSYRIVAMESTVKRDGKYIEKLGNYDPISKKVEIHKERIEYWISKGAVPTDTVKRLIKN
jgi:small subunit ribosomal protein S16